MSSPRLACLLLCLSAAIRAAADAAPSGSGEFLAKKSDRRLGVKEGQQCGNSGSDSNFYGNCDSGLECVEPPPHSPLGTPSTCQKVGQHEGQQCGVGSDNHFYGDCSIGLRCVPPAEKAPLGAPSICHKQCGSFGPDGDNANGTCSAGETCSGKAATPCRAWNKECYLYCEKEADRRLAVAQGVKEGQQCGSSGSDSNFHGNCDSGLECVEPPAHSPLGTPSTCHKKCGSFGVDGELVNGTCGAGQACSGKAATPCRAWNKECYMYCVDVNLFKNGEGQQCGNSGSDGHDHGECATGLECVEPAAGSLLGAPSTCQKAGQHEGQQCGDSGSTGYFYGSCSAGLRCVQPAAPADGAPPAPGAASVCRK